MGNGKGRVKDEILIGEKMYLWKVKEENIKRIERTEKNNSLGSKTKYHLALEKALYEVSLRTL